MWDFLNRRFEELLGAVVLAVMACIAFINVIVRYCTNFSFSSSEELTVNLFVWVVLLGTARAFREGHNFCMNVLYDAMPRRIRLILYLFGTACSAAFFFALVCEGSLEVMDEYSLDVVSESLAIPVWLYTAATPLFSLLILVRLFQKVREDFRTNNY